MAKFRKKPVVIEAIQIVEPLPIASQPEREDLSNYGLTLRNV